MATSQVRFGLVGFGAWGSCHAQAIEKASRAELVAIAARSQRTCAEARSKHPAADVTDDVAELIARDDVDVVDIVLPSFLHAETAAAALQAGKHVLLEKPMALAVDDCLRLVDLAREHHRRLAVGHEFRLSSLWGKVKSLIETDTIGRPQYVLVELSRRPYRHGADGWRFDIARVGNWILEEPIHFFDLARWYMEPCGPPRSVFAMSSSRDAEHPELQDNFSALMKFEDGGYAVISQTLSAFEHHQTVKIAGSKGAMWASWSGAMDRVRDATYSLRLFDGERLVDVPIERPTGELYELEDQIALMCQVVGGEAPPSVTGEDGTWSVAMCLAAQASVQSGAPQHMENFI